ncbi:MAG: inner membrane CreD family protein, partial [Bacteroidales bacterium]
MNAFNETKNWIANSITVKCLIIGFIILMLLIPAQMIKSLISERESLRDSVAGEIFSKWGNSQTISGPVVTVPYYWYSKEDEKTVRHIDYAHFLPDELIIESDVGTEIRYRGIYNVIVYNTRLRLHGRIPHPDFSVWKITEEDILWDEAFISVGIPDMRGIKKGVNIMWNNETSAVEPGIANVRFLQSGVRSTISMNEATAAGAYTFEVRLNLNGSESLNFVPAGKVTHVTMNSSWNNPSFDGAFLPEARDIRAEGFFAEWNILDLNRNYPQQWKGDA